MSGPVAVSLTANSDGRVQTCEIEETSGFDPLDQETCRMLRRRVRVAPSADNSRAEPFRYRVNWDICAVPEPGWADNREVPEVVQDLRRAQAHCRPR
jgi:TonB family protein